MAAFGRFLVAATPYAGNQPHTGKLWTHTGGLESQQLSYRPVPLLSASTVVQNDGQCISRYMAV